ELELESASAPLLQVFKALHASRPKGGGLYREVHDAMFERPSPAWKPDLLGILERPLDPSDVKVLTDEAFWQITAAHVLGRMRAEEAVRPLTRGLLSPSKDAIAATAVWALARIGKPAVAPTITLLSGADRELVEYARTEQERARKTSPAPHVAI